MIACAYNEFNHNLTCYVDVRNSGSLLGERYFELASLSLQVALEVLRGGVGALEVPL